MPRQQRHLPRDDAELRPARPARLLPVDGASESLQPLQHILDRAAEIHLDDTTGFVVENDDGALFAPVERPSWSPLPRRQVPGAILCVPAKAVNVLSASAISSSPA